MKHVLWGHLKLFVEMKNEEVLFAVVFLTMSFALNAANEVVQTYFTAAQKGDSQAQYNLGLCYAVSSENISESIKIKTLSKGSVPNTGR